MGIPGDQITTFGLLRHGQTEWNVQKRIQGQQDSSLTEEGVVQARKWGKFLQVQGWTKILASDLGRARETVGHIQTFFDIPSIFNRLLREQDWGIWTGHTIVELENEHGKYLAEQIQKGWDFCPPGGESRNAVYYRTRRALLEAAKYWSGEKVLVVCHEGVLKALVYKLSGRFFLPKEPALLKKAHLHTFSSTHDSLVLEAVNFADLSATRLPSRLIQHGIKV